MWGGPLPLHTRTPAPHMGRRVLATSALSQADMGAGTEEKSRLVRLLPSQPWGQERGLEDSIERFRKPGQNLGAAAPYATSGTLRTLRALPFVFSLAQVFNSTEHSCLPRPSQGAAASDWSGSG